MDKAIVLQGLRESFLFQSLSGSSRTALLDRWEMLSEEQLAKIRLLTVGEGVIAECIGQIGQGVLQETQRRAIQEMLQTLERSESARESAVINDLFATDGL